MGIADSLKFLDKSRGDPSFHDRKSEGGSGLVGGSGGGGGSGGFYVPREQGPLAEPPSGNFLFDVDAKQIAKIFRMCTISAFSSAYG